MVSSCVIEPLVAVTVIMYVPTGVDRVVDTVSVELEYWPTMVGNDIFGPFFTRGNIVVLRLMVPLKPFVPLIVIVKAAEEPLTRARLEGFALMPKTVTIVDRVLMSFPL